MEKNKMAINAVTDEMWQKINKKNREIVEEFLKQSSTLSDYTLKQYESGLKIYFKWIYDNKEDKYFYEIKSRDYLHYQNWLIEQGLSSSAIKFKRSCVSSLNNYIELYYSDEYPAFRNYINKGIANPTPAFVYEKEPLTLKEYKHLCDVLEEQKKWQQLAYIRFSFSSGARRNEVRQLTKESMKIEPKEINIDGKITKIYSTEKLRCKGRGKTGKIRTLQFDQNAFDAIQKWLDVRGEDDCPYVFVVRKSGNINKVGETVFSQWCEAYFEKIVGRRIHPHLFRESRATSMVVEQGKDISIAQHLLGHQSSETTKLYVIRDDENDSDDAF
jgi:site-specific recombinase XerD